MRDRPRKDPLLQVPNIGGVVVGTPLSLLRQSVVPQKSLVWRKKLLWGQLFPVIAKYLYRGERAVVAEKVKPWALFLVPKLSVIVTVLIRADPLALPLFIK